MAAQHPYQTVLRKWQWTLKLRHPNAKKVNRMNRREFLLGTPLSLTPIGAVTAGLLGCQRPVAPVRVASNVWLGYETLFLARELGYLSPATLRLIEYPSSSDGMMALANREVSLATLTLDEFLLAREGGLDARAILVFDESNGADAVVARADIQGLSGLKGKRIGVESTAVGALMLAKLLEVANLQLRDIIKVDVTVDQHVSVYERGQVDAVVTFEPLAQQLRDRGAQTLLDSSQFPGLILDLLVVDGSALGESESAIKELVAGHFRALTYLEANPMDAARLMAPRLQLEPHAVLLAWKGIRMSDLSSNRVWLSGASPRLTGVAETVGLMLQRARLLKRAPVLDRLCDVRFLPEAG